MARKKRRTKAQKAATAKMIAANKRKRKGKKRKAKKSKRGKAKVTGTPYGVGESKPKRRRRKKKGGGKKRRKGSKRGKRRTRKSKRRGGGGRVKTVKQRVVTVPKAGTQSVRIDLGGGRGGGKKKRRRRKNPETSIVRASNPSLFGGLTSNAGPFSRENLTGYVTLTGGVTLGFIGADMLDRYVSTMKPKNGKHPWMGRNAAAAYHRRPDALRLGVQAGGAVASMILTYFARNVKVLPWALGGLSIGFGMNFLRMLSQWFLMPALLKAGNGEIKPGNRLYPVEQGWVQDEVDNFFEQLTLPDLAAGQAGTDPIAPSPIGTPLSVYALGDGKKGNGNGEVGRAGQRRFIDTGRIGACASCGADGGCYSDCPNMCQECIRDNSDGTATYTVEQGDAYPAMVNVAGVNAARVSQLNGGRHWQEFWKVGQRVQVPYHFAVYLQGVGKHRAALAGPPQAPQQPQPPAPSQAPVTVMPETPAQPAGQDPSPQGLFNDAE